MLTGIWQDVRYGACVLFKSPGFTAAGGREMTGTWRDIIYSLRKLTRSPGFAATVILTTRRDGFDSVAGPEAYLAFRQHPFALTTLVARTVSESAGFVESAKQAVRSANPHLPISNAMLLEELASESLAPPRFALGVSIPSVIKAAGIEPLAALRHE